MKKGREAIDERIEEVTRLAYCAICGFFKKKGYDREDLLQEAVMGVLIYGDKFDPERGALSTFVSIVARNYLIERRFRSDTRHKRRVNFEAMSLDAPVRIRHSNEEGDPLVELISDGYDLETDVAARLDAEKAERLLDGMDERTAHIIRERYREEPKLLREIGEELGLSNERVRQLETAGLRELRTKMMK